MSTPPESARVASPEASLLGKPVLDAWMPTAVAESGPGREVLRAEAIEGKSKVLIHAVRVPVDLDAEATRAAIRQAQRLRHANILGVLMDGTLEDGRLVVVTPAIGAATLSTRLVTRPPGTSEVVHVLEAIAAALHAIHEQGRSYGPMSPEHVMIAAGPDSREEVRLMPLWWTWRHGFDEAPAHRWTLPIPLRRGGREAAMAADVWSLGAIGWHALCGRPPIARETEINAPPDLPALSSLVKRSLPPDLEQLITSLLDPDPARRPRDLLGVAAQLGDIAHTLEGGGPSIAPPMLLATPVPIGGQLREHSLVLPVPPPAPTNPVPPPRRGALMATPTPISRVAMADTTDVPEDRSVKPAAPVDRPTKEPQERGPGRSMDDTDPAGTPLRSRTPPKPDQAAWVLPVGVSLLLVAVAVLLGLYLGGSLG